MTTNFPCLPTTPITAAMLAAPAAAAGWNVCVSISREHAVVSLEKGLSWNPEVIVMWYN